MTRFLLLIPATLVAGCATPDLPDGPDGAPQWYDDQLESADGNATAPETIPSRSLSAAEDARRARATVEVLQERDELNSAERAQRVETESESYADRNRVRTTPPERDD